MKSHENSRSQKSNKLQAIPRWALAAGLATVSLANTAPAQAKEPTSREVATAARNLTQLFHRTHNVKNLVDLHHSIRWNPGGPQSTFENETDHPIKQKIKGHTEYFWMAPKGPGLSSMVIEPIPKEDIVSVHNSPEFPDSQTLGVSKTVTSTGNVFLAHGDPNVWITTTTDNANTHETTRIRTQIPVGITKQTEISGVG